MELWLHTFAFPGKVADVARQGEQWDFAGLLVADSQNLTADIWVELALAGAATSTLRVGPGVTNPLTRHLAVTASAAATLQAETGGRATLGFSQGDSALSQVGLRRLSVDEFEHALEILQGFLRGDQAHVDRTTSAIRWLADSDLPKVPVHVGATGPRAIAAGAGHAEGVDLTVGASLERVRSGVTIAREAGPPELVLGGVRERCRRRRPGPGAPAGARQRGDVCPFSADPRAPDDQVAARVARAYQREQHGRASASMPRTGR